VLFGYVGYVFVLRLLVALVPRPVRAAGTDELPTVTMLIPVHNELGTIEAKLENVRSLQYPAGQLEVLFICDGCTDGTAEYVSAKASGPIRVLQSSGRSGKAAALNLGLHHARHDIVVFTDASIMLEPLAVVHIVRSFASPDIGCVSGEDRIGQAGGEGLYGRYELALRRLESQLHSIVGASGSFYAQRRTLCETFLPGFAPDFLSVLRCVARGYRAVSEPSAVGVMAELADPRAEFDRKVRTILRGMTTLAPFAYLLNPFRYGWFAFALFSHKVVRWVTPLFLAVLVFASGVLAANSSFYLIVFLLQLAFYGLAAVAFMGLRGMAEWLPARVSLYFTSANLAAALAWMKFIRGTRQELWVPSRR
jgi:cellulose synthase/poly-beta-1,6-N-acetylglucosamine synthase-like glycosyltransferase